MAFKLNVKGLLWLVLHSASTKKRKSKKATSTQAYKLVQIFNIKNINPSKSVETFASFTLLFYCLDWSLFFMASLECQ